MAIPRNPKAKPWQGRPPILLLALGFTAISLLFLLSSMSSSLSSTYPKFLDDVVRSAHSRVIGGNDKYLYWGYGIDCPGKHCDTCAGLGHQESSLRCALEEALVLQRTFVMPSRMCINPMHNNKGLLKQATNTSSEAEWMAAFCPMDTLYDLDLISKRVPVILDNSKMWYRAQSTSMKLGSRGVAHVNGVSRAKLKENSDYANILLINRTASPLAWFAECKDRKYHSAILLPYSFLPSMAAKKLRDTADKIKALLGDDYDAIHVRRGDILKTRKDRFGVERSLHPHADRDTRPEFILQRIAKWVPPGRTLYIGSNERTPNFFSPLSVRYKLAYSSNYTEILDPVVENNYQLFMIERLVMMGAKTFINTFKSEDSEYSLSDDPKKAPKEWKKVVHTMEEEDGS